MHLPWNISSTLGFKCLSKEGRIFISKDVKFNEHYFPFPALFPSQKLPQEPVSAGGLNRLSVPTAININPPTCVSPIVGNNPTPNNIKAPNSLSSVSSPGPHSSIHSVNQDHNMDSLQPYLKHPSTSSQAVHNIRNVSPVHISNDTVPSDLAPNQSNAPPSSHESPSTHVLRTMPNSVLLKLHLTQQSCTQYLVILRVTKT
ncbi:unnamed protein product [Lathyrus sativus]|nr:unnamed protein product [Lathyrus sativus]